MLENLYQAHNASAVVRSCECFGVQDLHIIESDNDFKLSKTITMGSAKWVDVKRYQENKACIETLKKQGYRIAAMTLRPGSIPLDQLPIAQKTALCFGTEETGLTEAMHDMADEFVHLPMYGFTQSFNISVSAALTLNTLVNKLHHSNTIPWELSKEKRLETKLAWMIKTAPNGKKIVKDFLNKAMLSE